MHECIFIMNVFMVALCTMIVCRGFFLCMDCHVPIFMNVLRQNIMGMFFLPVYSYRHDEFVDVTDEASAVLPL